MTPAFSSVPCLSFSVPGQWAEPGHHHAGCWHTRASFSVGLLRAIGIEATEQPAGWGHPWVAATARNTDTRAHWRCPRSSPMLDVEA